MYTGESNKFEGPVEFFINVGNTLNIRNIRIYYQPDWVSSQFKDFFSFNFSKNNKIHKSDSFCAPENYNTANIAAEYYDANFFKDKIHCKNKENCLLPITDEYYKEDNLKCRNKDLNLANEPCGPNFSSCDNNTEIKNVTCCENIIPTPKPTAFNSNKIESSCKTCETPTPTPTITGNRCKNNDCLSPNNFYSLSVGEGPGFFRNSSLDNRTKICTLYIKSCISRFDNKEKEKNYTSVSTVECYYQNPEKIREGGGCGCGMW